MRTSPYLPYVFDNVGRDEAASRNNISIFRVGRCYRVKREIRFERRSRRLRSSFKRIRGERVRQQCEIGQRFRSRAFRLRGETRGTDVRAREMETSTEPAFSLSQSDICRLCGLSNASGFLIYEKADAAELTIADLINRYLPVKVSAACLMLQCYNIRSRKSTFPKR